jgi:hypothetical protein
MQRRIREAGATCPLDFYPKGIISTKYGYDGVATFVDGSKEEAPKYISDTSVS